MPIIAGCQIRRSSNFIVLSMAATPAGYHIKFMVPFLTFPDDTGRHCIELEVLKKGDIEQEMFPDLSDISPHLLKKHNIFLHSL